MNFKSPEFEISGFYIFKNSRDYMFYKSFQKRNKLDSQRSSGL